MGLTVTPGSGATLKDHTDAGEKVVHHTIDAHSAGGWTPYKLISAATTNAQSIKGSPGQIGFIVVGNVHADPRFVKFYNKASAPTVGTDTPVLTLMIPGNVKGSGLCLPVPAGIEFTTGIAMAITADEADADTTTIGAGDVTVNVGYH